jgi:anti-sigma regulatory factor (Ser/Thr protein kinase)
METGMEHDLLVYRDDEELARQAGAFLEAAIDEGSEPILVADPHKRELVQDALGTGADGLQLIDSAAHYTRPEAALADYDATLRRLARKGARSMRLFAELPAWETQPERERWLAYEAIVNHALAHHPVWIICAYDSRLVPDATIEGMRRTHRHLAGQASQELPEYSDPSGIVRELTPEPLPMPDLEDLAFDGNVRAFRERLRQQMAEAAVTPGDVDGMLVAAHEVLANAQRHGRGVHRVRAGRVDGQFVLEISDRGPGLDDSLAGYLPPLADGADRAGLWVARQLTRRLELLSDPPGLTVRLWI